MTTSVVQHEPAPPRATEKQLAAFLELAVLNERLSGNISPWEARIKMDALKRQRSAWAFVYERVTASNKVASLAEIEAVFAEVRASSSSASH
jgi:hypothetical protein